MKLRDTTLGKAIGPLWRAIAPALPAARERTEHDGDGADKASRRKLGDIAGVPDDLEPPAIDAADEARVAAIPDTFAICRIIGNDLVPRHSKGQAYENVRFILENEPDFEDCTKLWLLNRWTDAEEEARIIGLLDQHGQTYDRVPFSLEEFRGIGHDFAPFPDCALFFDGSLLQHKAYIRSRATLQSFRLKNNYVMNNNGARNAALEMCIDRAKWALPLDGNCYFTRSAWDALRADILADPGKRYFVIPMARITRNEDLLESSFESQPVEEPQIAFRCDAPVRYNEAHAYGRRPKVEMLLHLGVPGPWRQWTLEFFDLPPRPVTPEGHRVGQAGWVARLASGVSELEQANKQSGKDRDRSRDRAIRVALETLEASVVATRLGEGGPLIYAPERLDAALASERASVEAAAEKGLGRGPYSVTDKPAPGPSGDLRDYFQSAPLWWPNPETSDGRPYIRREGRRNPEATLFGPGSEKFDRSRLQRLCDDMAALGLATRLTGDARFRDHARLLVENWFLDPETGMNPNLAFARVRPGLNGDRGYYRGIIEAKDFAVLLDGVRLLGDADLTTALVPWCSEYYGWLTESRSGRTECAQANHHGTCYDLQAAAFAAFLGRVPDLQEISLRLQARLFHQFAPDGALRLEPERGLTQHFTALTLQSWIALFALMEGAGFRLWQTGAGDRLAAGLRWMLSTSRAGWPYPMDEPFDIRRLVPLNAALLRQTGDSMLEGDDAPAVFHPGAGVTPFWTLLR